MGNGWVTRKDLEGSGRGLTELLSRHLSGENEEKKHYKSRSVQSVSRKRFQVIPPEIWVERHRIFIYLNWDPKFLLFWGLSGIVFVSSRQWSISRHSETTSFHSHNYHNSLNCRHREVWCSENGFVFWNHLIRITIGLLALNTEILRLSQFSIDECRDNEWSIPRLFNDAVRTTQHNLYIVE
jgi:hypothetical protein